MLATWRWTIAKCSQAFITIAKHWLAILATSYRLNRIDRVLVAFTGLEGVNSVFSHVSLILVTTSSIFAKSLLTSFLALVIRTCAPMFLVQNAWVSHFFSQKSSSWHFLALAKLRSTAQAGNHQRISNSWKKIDCRLSYDSFLAHATLQGDSAAFLATFAAGSSTCVE